MYTTPETTQLDLPQKLSDFLWPLIYRELERENIDLAFIKCSLSSDGSDGNLVQRIFFWGNQYTLSGFPPVTADLYIYMDSKCHKFLTV